MGVGQDGRLHMYVWGRGRERKGGEAEMACNWNTVWKQHIWYKRSSERHINPPHCARLFVRSFQYERRRRAACQGAERSRNERPVATKTTLLSLCLFVVRLSSYRLNTHIMSSRVFHCSDLNCAVFRCVIKLTNRARLIIPPKALFKVRMSSGYTTVQEAVFQFL